MSVKEHLLENMTPLCPLSYTEGYFVLFRFFHLSLNSFLLFFVFLFHAVIVLLQPSSFVPCFFHDGLFASREFVVLTSIINLSASMRQKSREKKGGWGMEVIYIQRPAKDLEASARRASSVCVGQTGDSINILRAIKTTPPARRGVFFFVFDSYQWQQSIFFSCVLVPFLTPQQTVKNYMKWGVDRGQTRQKEHEKKIYSLSLFFFPLPKRKCVFLLVLAFHFAIDPKREPDVVLRKRAARERENKKYHTTYRLQESPTSGQNLFIPFYWAHASFLVRFSSSTIPPFSLPPPFSSASVFLFLNLT